MKEARGQGAGTALAYTLVLVTITVWGFTFISTKVLLISFEPIEILFYRFFIGYCALWLIRPHFLRMKERKHHLLFATAGFFGVCLYFLLENIALTYATASNISVTVATAPMFTAIVARIFRKQHTLTLPFICGFVVAMVGITLVSFADVSTVHAGWGDVLAIFAAISWAAYSNIISYLADQGYESIAITKRCFAWGLPLIAIALVASGAPADFSRFASFANTGNFLFLGLIASAGCFAMWGYSVEKLGAAKTSAFIYLSPPITVVASVFMLGEPFTLQTFIGCVLVIGGLLLSEGRFKSKRLNREN